MKYPTNILKFLTSVPYTWELVNLTVTVEIGNRKIKCDVTHNLDNNFQ